MLLCPVASGGGSSSGSYGSAACVTLSALHVAAGEIRQAWYDEIAELPTTLCHLEQLPLLWRPASVN
jgi:hypothetical protein